MSDDHEAMVEACAEAAKLVRLHGSAEMQVAMRVLMHLLAGDVMERAGRPAKPDAPQKPDGDGHDG